LAFRQLRRNKAFTTVTRLTLALGTGANTAIFSLVHAVVLQSLPVAHAQQLYRLGDRESRGRSRESVIRGIHAGAALHGIRWRFKPAPNFLVSWIRGEE